MYWYADARVWQLVHPLLMARAMFVGSKLVGSPMTRTPSRAMATVWQSAQLLARARRGLTDAALQPMRLFHWSNMYLSLLFVAVALDPLLAG